MEFTVHLETGLKMFFLTFDHSYNRTSGAEMPDLIDQSLNLGVQFHIYTGDDGQRGSIWIKAGKSIKETGYNEEYPAWWGGKNLEVKVVFDGLF